VLGGKIVGGADRSALVGGRAVRRERILPTLSRERPVKSLTARRGHQDEAV